MQDNKGYASNWVEELKLKNNIVSVISSYIKIEKKGKSYWGCCPFHHERTPSFCINDYDGFYHCFGCGESGDVIKFVQKFENIDFTSAIKILAGKVGMEVPTFAGDEEFEKKKKQKERILQLLDCAKKHYMQNLLLPSAKDAQNYIKMRKLTGKEIKDFEIGYSLSWVEIITYLKSMGFSNEELSNAGIMETKNGRSYDVFGKRLMFPICNSFGDCIGFSARILEKSDFAKYKNSAQNLVFDKSKIVYGINLIKKLKTEKGCDSIIIVEGQMDVIAMHKAGFLNTVACMGTALTPFHAKELKRFCDKVFVCFDGDGAGKKATMRSLDILKEAGLDVFVVSLPNGNDPDEIIKLAGSEGVQKEIDKALPMTDYKLFVAKQKYDISKPDQKSKFLADATNIISTLSSNAEKDTYLQQVSKESSVPVDILRKDLKTSGTLNEQSSKNEQKLSVTVSAQSKAEAFIVASYVYKKDWAVYDRCDLELVESIELNKIMQNLFEKHSNNETFQIGNLFDYENDENNQALNSILNYNFSAIGENCNNYFADCKQLLLDISLKKEQQQLIEQFKSESDSEKRKQLTLKISELTKKIKNKN